MQFDTGNLSNEAMAEGVALLGAALVLANVVVLAMLLLAVRLAG